MERAARVRGRAALPVSRHASWAVVLGCLALALFAPAAANATSGVAFAGQPRRRIPGS